MKSCGSMSILPPKLPPTGGWTIVMRLPVEPEAVGELLAVHEDHVHRAPHREVAVGTERGDHDVGLDRGGSRLRGRVRALDDDRGSGGRGVHVAVLEVPPHRDVAADVFELVVDRRRSLGERVRRIEDGWQHVVVDVDQVERPLSRLLVDGRHGRHLVADEPNRVRLERDVVVVVAEGTLLHVGRMDHRPDTREPLRGRDVDRSDPRVRVGAPEDPAHEQAGQPEVFRVDGLPRDLLGRVELRQAPPDDAQPLYRLRGDAVLLSLRDGASLAPSRLRLPATRQSSTRESATISARSRARSVPPSLTT